MSDSLAVDYQEDYGAIADDMAYGLELPEITIKGSKHNPRLMIKAVCLYQVLGKLCDVAKFMGLPEGTIKTWRQKDWWDDISNQLKREKTALFETRADNIINLGFNSIEQRLKHGDYATYDQRNQEVILKPVSAKDSATILGIMFDKRQISRALPTSISQSTTTHLIDIKGQFDAMTQAKTIEGTME